MLRALRGGLGAGALWLAMIFDIMDQMKARA